MIEETIRSLQERYPEDLNSIYNCYWWVTQGLYKEGDVILESRSIEFAYI